MTITLPNVILLSAWSISAVYVHYRGKIRHKFFRQLTDHSTLMAPINAFMYLFSAIPSKPYCDLADFPELKPLQDNWHKIREEALALSDHGEIKASEKYDDVGFNSFFRRGWKRFYISWYGTDIPSAAKLCPKTLALVKSIPNIKAAMFTMLPPGARLVKHRDPYAGSLRYHLGLITPNSEKCRIYVDGQAYHWQDGEAVMFDETYIHYAINESEENRIIFFCDVARPMRYRFARVIRDIVSRYFMAASAATNTPGDPIGIFNRLFKYVYAIRLVGKRLKAYNKTLYYIVKYIVFGGLLYLLFFR